MCAMHERQQEEAEPWLKSGISGWIKEETNANMSKAAGVGNHFYLWITPYNWDDTNTYDGNVITIASDLRV